MSRVQNYKKRTNLIVQSELSLLRSNHAAIYRKICLLAARKAAHTHAPYYRLEAESSLDRTRAQY